MRTSNLHSSPFLQSTTACRSYFWLLALGGHLVLLRILLTPAERAKLRLPAKAWLILLSITLADLVALLLGLPFTALFEIYDDWLFGSLLCHLAPFVKTTAVTVSAYGILALLLQCFEIACKAHRPKTPPTTLTFLVTVIWVLALVTALPLLIAPAVRVYRGPEHEDLEMLMFEHDLEETEATEEEEKKNSNETLVERQACYIPYRFGAIYSYSLLLELLVQFAVPLVMVVYLFIKTADSMNSKAVAAKGVRRRTDGEQQQQQQQQTPQLPQISKHEVIFVRTVLILSVVYHLLRTPVILLEHFIVFPFKHGITLWNALTVLSESTYFIKPFLLLAVNGNFQNALRTIGASATDTTEDANQVNFNKLEEEPTTP